ncbi:glycosyltransferase [Cryobacterium sp. Hz9]|uniref:glycosyltransferase n=1 Tax=Cryobacterium sp. Hz9 TaxID=1259167 RepID=UPI00106BB38D|nr:glycosyltransferase [Cryobacterium sp. Hz9]TFB66992.1 glycosyltransferase family 1 protein [Cryobacterium sp. Hz9]
MSPRNSRSSPDLSAALLGRLTAVAPYFFDAPEEIDALVSRGNGPLLARLIAVARERRGDDLFWLLIAGVTAAYPNPDQLQMTRRAVALADERHASSAFLQACFDAAARFDDLDKGIAVISAGTVIDVDFCANHRHNTGIQRVVRQTMSRWTRNRDMTLVAWTAGGGAMRTMTPLERSRVVEWNTYTEPEPDHSPVDPPDYQVIIPFNSEVILPEVPQAVLCNALAALAQYSGNRVGLIGYDTIPVVSADSLDSLETERFVRYLTILKYAKRVVGISAAATEEFAGFVAALPAQGLSGPTTVEVSLPVDSPDGDTGRDQVSADSPLVICIGSQEPRKNHLAVLFASEVLWREGIDFRLRFIGGGSVIYTRDFDKRVRQLQRAGRQVEVLRGVNDAVLLASYREARFSLFPSLHEGYGLPVAESIALATPVLTSNYGSTAEIAADGGCLAVDPRDDDAIIDAMRTLLTDDEVLAALQREIGARTVRNWDDYADELWEQLIEPLRNERHV